MKRIESLLKIASMKFETLALLPTPVITIEEFKTCLNRTNEELSAEEGEPP